MEDALNNFFFKRSKKAISKNVHILKKITSGAADDLQKVSKLAQSLITKFGMSEKLGYMGFLEGDFQNKYSDKSQQVLKKKQY